MKQHQKIQSSLTNNKNGDCKFEVNVLKIFFHYRQENVEILEAFSDMWDGHLE